MADGYDGEGPAFSERPIDILAEWLRRRMDNDNVIIDGAATRQVVKRLDLLSRIEIRLSSKKQEGKLNPTEIDILNCINDLDIGVVEDNYFKWKANPKRLKYSDVDLMEIAFSKFGIVCEDEEALAFVKFVRASGSEEDL